MPRLIKSARLALLAVAALRANGFIVHTARRPLATSSRIQSLPAAGRGLRLVATRAAAPDTDTEVAAMLAEAAQLRAEVKELEASVQLQAQQKTDVNADMRSKSFNAFDVNQDGVVDLLELKTGLFDKFGLVCEDAELLSVVQMFDKNQDGVLQVDEFSVGQIKMKVEQLQDKARNDAREADQAERRRAEDAAKPASERMAELVADSPNDDAGLATRAASCVPYLLPLVDGCAYGYHLLAQAPLAGAALAPFVILLRAVPFGGLILFFLFSSQSRNPNLPLLLRFNLQQAIMLDIALFFPSLFGLLPIAEDIKAVAAEPASDAVFLVLVACIFYSWATNLATGKLPNKIPLIGSTSEKQIGGPFDEDK